MTIELPEARLCMDCDLIHTKFRCPRCGGQSFGYVQTWLNNKPSETHEEVNMSY